MQLTQRDNSMLTFETSAIQGTAGIIEKLLVRILSQTRTPGRPNRGQALPFNKVQHRVATLDAQPSSEAGGIIVLVTGALLVCWHSNNGISKACRANIELRSTKSKTR